MQKRGLNYQGCKSFYKLSRCSHFIKCTIYIDMNRIFIRKHVISFSIILFLLVFYGINLAKPDCMYNEDGSFRQFGIGYKKKTVVPAWLVAIIVAQLSYLGVLYYLAHPRI